MCVCVLFVSVRLTWTTLDWLPDHFVPKASWDWLLLNPKEDIRKWMDQSKRSRASKWNLRYSDVVVGSPSLNAQYHHQQEQSGTALLIIIF